MQFFLKDSSQPTLIKTLDRRRKVHIQVVGPGLLQLGTSRAEVQSNYGIQLQQGTGGPNNIESLEWEGELWASCTDANTQIFFVFPELSQYLRDTFSRARAGVGQTCS